MDEGEPFPLSTDGHRDYYSAPGAYRTGDGSGTRFEVRDYNYGRRPGPFTVRLGPDRLRRRRCPHRLHYRREGRPHRGDVRR